MKYKILRSELGVRDQKIYKLPEDKVSHVKEEYTKRKGLEYLRDGNSNAAARYLALQREAAFPEAKKKKVAHSASLGGIPKGLPRGLPFKEKQTVSDTKLTKRGERRRVVT